MQLKISLCRYFIFLILISMSSSSFAEILEARDLTGIIPSFWFDRSGFDIQGDHTEGYLPSNSLKQDIFPMFPLYKSGSFGRNTFVGAIVKAETLEKYENKALAKIKIKRQILNLKFDDGTSLIPYEYEDAIYGIRSDYTVARFKSTSIGLSFDFGLGDKVIVLGETKVYGLHLDFSRTIKINPEKGLNIGTSFQNVIESWQSMMRTDDSEKIIQQAIQLTPYLMSYFTTDNDAGENNSLKPLVGLKSKDESPLLQQTEKLPQAISDQNLSDEFKKLKRDLNKHVADEAKWREKLSSNIENEVIIKNDELNKLVQTICDRLNTVYQLPPEIYPRCRVAATLVPNAWAYPGGDIFITAGLIGILSEVDSVALILGHEMGHVLGRHTSKSFPYRQALSYSASFVSIVANLGLTGFSLGAGWGLLGPVQLLTWYPQALATSMGSSYIADKALQLSFLPPAAALMLQSRENEMQADRIGQEAAFASGADLEEMNQGWEEFILYFKKYFSHKNTFMEKILADHPSGESRQKYFAKRSTALNAKLQTENQTNLFSLEMRNQYRDFYKALSPYSQKYGLVMKKKSLLKDDYKSQHFFHTMSGVQGQCIQHALSGQ